MLLVPVPLTSEWCQLGRSLLPGLDGSFPHTAVLLQGGEAAAALLSQLDLEPGGEDDYVWNIKVRRCSSARLTIPNTPHLQCRR